jgi:capsid protein
MRGGFLKQGKEVGISLWALLVVTLLAAACNAGQKAQEPESTLEHAAEQTQEQDAQEVIAQAPRGHRGEPGDQLKDMQAGQPGGDLTDEEKCQLNKVVADVGRGGAEQLVRDWALSSLKADSPDANLMEAVEDIGQAQSFSSFLAERGYTC